MIPNSLQKGDKIGIIAPSDPIRKEDSEEINRSITLIEASGFECEFGKYAFSNTTGYGASPEEKAKDIEYFFSRPDIKMIWCARGGANSNTLFSYLNYDSIRKNPKIICGYSDSTSLLNMIYQKTGLVTFLGETFKGLTTWQTSYSYEEIIKRFQKADKTLGKDDDKYTSVVPGEAEGILVGGNLSLISLMACGTYCLDFKDKILVLEELGFETDPAGVSHYLYYLKQNHVFDQIGGLWIGNYKHPSGISLEQIVLEVVGKTPSFPILKSNNFGHTDRKTVIPIGVKAKIQAGKIELVEPCVK